MCMIWINWASRILITIMLHPLKNCVHVQWCWKCFSLAWHLYIYTKFSHYLLYMYIKCVLMAQNSYFLRHKRFFHGFLIVTQNKFDVATITLLSVHYICAKLIRSVVINVFVFYHFPTTKFFLLFLIFSHFWQFW